MSNERLEVLLLQVRDVANDVADFILTTSREEFDRDVMKERSVIMSVQIIGELMGKIQTTYPDFVASHPDVPWIEVRGLRNRIAHGYFSVRRDVIWQTATVSIPALLEALADALPPHSGS